MAGASSALQAIRLCVFDVRLGQREGQEAEKILYFFPENTAPWEQLALVGLAEGLITFTRMFSPSSPCEVMDGEKHSNVFVECEPHIWMVLAAEKGGPGGIEGSLRTEALRDVLREAYSLFRLLYGPIARRPSENQPGFSPAQCLSAFFSDYFSGGAARKKWKLPSTSDGLTEQQRVQLLPVDRQTFLNVQSVVGCLQTSRNSLLNRDSVFMFHDMLLSTTLPPSDTVALCTYCKLRLSPSALSSSTISSKSIAKTLFQSRSSPVLQVPDSALQGGALPRVPTSTSNPPAFGRSKLRSLFRNAAVNAPLPRPAVQKPISPSHSDRPASTRGTEATGSTLRSSPALSKGGCSAPSRPRFSAMPRPLKLDAWCRSNGGCLETSAWGMEDGRAVTPIVHIDSLHASGGDDGWRELAAFQHKGLTVLILNAIGDGVRDATLDLIELVERMLQELEEVVARQWGSPVASHIKGHRYLCIDHAGRTARASPAVKVGTLTKESLSLLSQLRQEADLDKRRRSSGRVQSGGDSKCSEQQGADDLGDGEICVRGQNNAWVMSRRVGEWELWTVMERASETLLLAAEAVEQMNALHFDDIFSSS